MPLGADLVAKAIAAGFPDAAELLWRASDEALGFPASWITTSMEAEAVRLQAFKIFEREKDACRPVFR